MSSVKQYIDRSFDIIRRNTVNSASRLKLLFHPPILSPLCPTRLVCSHPALRMNPSPKPGALPIFSFHHAPLTSLSDIATGSDADIGGVSTAEITLVPSTVSEVVVEEEQGEAEDATASHMAFHGTLSLHVPPEFAGRIRTGYAAFRSKTRPSLFGEDTWNLELYSHLRVQVAYRGWEGWRSKFVCNLQTDGPVR